MRAPKYARTTAKAGLMDTPTSSSIESACFPMRSRTISEAGELMAPRIDAASRRRGGNGTTIGKTTMIIDVHVISGGRPKEATVACCAENDTTQHRNTS